MVMLQALSIKADGLLRSNRPGSVLLLLLVLLLTSQSLLAEVRASLSRQAIQEGDSVSLNIFVRDETNDSRPDLGVLQQDFEILGTGSSQQTSIINGKRSSSRQWNVELMPKRLGELTIPAIVVGQQSTQSLSLSVTAQPAAAVAQAGEPVFIKTMIESLDATFYVQQQIRYTLKLFYRERLYDGSFDGPHVDNALLERLGDDRQYQTTVDGQQYQVVERHYAIFPEQSGSLTVPPVTFNGRLTGQSRQRQPSLHMNEMMEQFFGSSNLASPGKRIRLRGESFTFDIQPRPANYSGQHWLPAEQLELTDSWAKGPPDFNVGEPVTRTIAMEVKGLEATHLPDFSLQSNDAVRLYPEKPVYTNRTDGEWIYGRLEQTITYVPSSAGMQTLPAINVDWWDTASGEQRTTQLPAWTINVMPGDAVTPATIPPQEGRSTGNIENTGETLPELDKGAHNLRALSALPFHWFYLLAVLLVVIVAAFLLRSRRMNTVNEAASATASALRPARAAVREACRQNNAVLTANSLLQWAALTWPDDPPRNLGAISDRLQGGDSELAALARALYGQASQDWQGDALLRVFDRLFDRHRQLLKQAKSSNRPMNKSGLLPLYPDWKT